MWKDGFTRGVSYTKNRNLKRTNTIAQYKNRNLKSAEIGRSNRHRKIDQSDLLPAFLVYSMYGYSFILYGDACCIESLSGEQEASADLSTFPLFIGEEVKVNQSDVLLNLHTH